MEVKYSKHLETRLKLRGIDIELPKRIYERAEERFLDRETENRIALKRAYLYGKEFCYYIDSAPAERRSKGEENCFREGVRL